MNITVMTEDQTIKYFQEEIERHESAINRLKAQLVRYQVCMKEGHVHPEISPDYYFCERCGEYLG